MVLGVAISVSASGSTTANEVRGSAQSDTFTVYWRQYGEGPPMLLVHGWGADCRSNWLDTGWVNALKSLRTLICIDVRGHGDSDKPYAHTPYSYAAMSNDVLAVMDTLDIEQADYLGYSMGAFMGAWLLGHHPQRFRSMVLGGIGDETEDSAAQGAVIGAALRAEGDLNALHPAAKAVRDFAAANPRNDLISLAYSAERMWPEGYPFELAGDGLRRAELPVLIVNGTLDEPYVHTGRKFAEALPMGQYTSLPDQDHLTAVSDPRFMQRVVAFLQGGN